MFVPAVANHLNRERAAFVACDRDTILNERKRDSQFDSNVKRARKMRIVRPLDVIYRASLTSWRAAAWLVHVAASACQLPLRTVSSIRAVMS